MHVCLLTSGRFRPHSRARRHADALYAAGHAVTVCARGVAGEPDHDLRDGIDIERIPEESLYAGARGVLDGVRYALGYVHPSWVRAGNRVDEDEEVDAYGVCDLSLVKTGVALGNDHDAPVVCDLPGVTAAVEGGEARGGRLRRLARGVFHPRWRRERLVTTAVPATDRLVTTCEEARAEYVREKGIDPSRVSVVRDTVAPSDDDRDRTGLGLGFDPETAFVVTAVVEGASSADLETLVEAAARAADRAASLRLVILGDPGEATLDHLETLARRRLAAGRITFRTETDRTNEYLAASDVRLFLADPKNETSVPEGVFAALAAGVPVVAADAPPVRRVLADAAAGRVVPMETGALADALVSLADPETRGDLGANARRAAETTFSQAYDADRLRWVYETVVAAPSANGPATRFESAIRYEPTS